MKKFFLNTILLFAGFFLFAQTDSKNLGEVVEEEIELPDVTTVINGKTFTAGKDSVPDYREIQPESAAPEVQLPQMEGVTTSKELPEKKEGSYQKEKDIYAEGQLGAGYPFYFKGDFSIYRASGKSPFEIDFAHESTEGFAGKKADEGFFERNTGVKGIKSLYGEKGNHNIQAEYKMSDDGLQLNSDSYSDMVKHTISAAASSDWEFSNGLLLSYGADGAWFNRYGQIMKGSVKSGNYIDGTRILDLNPYIGLGWQGYGFKAFFSTLYGFQANLAGSNNLLQAQGSSSSESSHRGQFKLDFSWHNDFISAGADGSLIVGTAIGSKELIPAFTGKFDFKTESFTPDRFITISLRGGLDSYQEKIRNLENKYRFAVLPVIPVETTDWFTKIDVSLPIKSAFEAKAGFEFKKSAFENGVWSASYDSDSLLSITGSDSTVYKSGLYAVSAKDRTEFNSSLGFYADFQTVKAGAEWKAFWNDTPSLEDPQRIKLSLEYQSEDAKWNAGTSTAFPFGSGADSTPEISGWAGIRLASALSLAFEVNDVIKLLSGKSRDYASSDYITTSGNAVLLAKFQF
ncbi:MAG: hypothetical protein K5873_05575 [Treponema sp.]|nr:hypothetical protein [Treponema sp.]